MSTKFLISTIAGTLFTFSAHAYNCSGGTDGGMDATGNQCNDVAAVATEVSSGRPTSTRSPKAETNKATSADKSASKLTVVRRDVPANPRNKHS